MSSPAQRPTPEHAAEEPGPAGFKWAEEISPADDLVPGHAGCKCSSGACQRGTCPCAAANVAADSSGRLVILPPTEPAQLELTECGPSCACFGACGIGFSAAGGAAADVRRAPGKGSGGFAAEPLPAGTLVCHYAGEYVSNAEAQRRLAEYDRAGAGHALLVLREWLPSGTAAVRLNIDATHKGNLARFLNHSCDGGNLRILLGRRTGSLLPRVLFVTSRAVQEGEELTYSYGPPNEGPQGRPCGCGTPACRGFMPHEDV